MLAVRQLFKRAALESAHPCRAYAGGEIRILAMRAADASPARIVRNVALRRVGELDADGGGLARRYGLGLLDGRIVPGAGDGDLDRQRRHPAVRDVLVDHERDAEAGVLHLELLHPAGILRAHDAHQRADLVAADHVGVDVPAVLPEIPVIVNHQLAGLLLQRHARTEFARPRLGAVERIFGMDCCNRQHCTDRKCRRNSKCSRFHWRNSICRVWEPSKTYWLLDCW